IGSSETLADQASNTLGNILDHLTASVIGDVNSEVDTEIRQGPQVNGNQPPVHSWYQSSTDEDLLPKQAQDVEKVGAIPVFSHCPSGNDSIGRVQPQNCSGNAVHPKPCIGDDLSSKEDATSENGVIFKEGKTGHTIQGSCAKPSMAKVSEEGPFQTSAEESNEVVTSSPAKPSTSEEELAEETEKGKSLQKQRVCYKV
ncbi:unnamed protein product, partial [Pocillopora meandrina]